MSTLDAATPAEVLAILFFLTIFVNFGSLQPHHAIRSEPITYADYYPDANARPNACRISHNVNKTISHNATNYVPFIGTSIVRDSQLLVLRLFYSSLDFPVKYFVVVVPERALRAPHGGMWYELEHLKEYATNVVIITCTNPPSVAEGWNAVFQAFPDEPWGVYCARDTAWMPGSLRKLAWHMWGATNNNSLEIGLVQWTFDNKGGEYNSFAMTRPAINRFGLFDENIYPCFYEDNDFQMRQARMQPPMHPKIMEGVVMHHGKPYDSTYLTGMGTPDDPTHADAEIVMSSFWRQRHGINGMYVQRKWGCQPGHWASCAFQTPFNKSVPVWYWHTSKEQQKLDSGLRVQGSQLVDAQGNLVLTIPTSYIGWAGYAETQPVCRLSGPLGIVGNTSSGLTCI